MSRGVVIGALCWLVAGLCAGCERSPLEFDCPDLDVGDLVVSEVRGPQSGEDVYGDWLELYNASGASVALRGALITITELDGSSSATILVREQTTVASGSYLVLGRQLEASIPSHVDYGYLADFDSDLFDTGAVQVYGCDRELEIDRTIYHNLPSKGTFGLDGAIDPPSAAANDDDAAWCVDDEADANSLTDGIRGTPRERNRACM